MMSFDTLVQLWWDSLTLWAHGDLITSYKHASSLTTHKNKLTKRWHLWMTWTSHMETNWTTIWSQRRASTDRWVYGANCIEEEVMSTNIRKRKVRNLYVQLFATHVYVYIPRSLSNGTIWWRRPIIRKFERHSKRQIFEWLFPCAALSSRYYIYIKIFTCPRAHCRWMCSVATRKWRRWTWMRFFYESSIQSIQPMHLIVSSSTKYKLVCVHWSLGCCFLFVFCLESSNFHCLILSSPQNSSRICYLSDNGSSEVIWHGMDVWGSNIILLSLSPSRSLVVVFFLFEKQ